jgi:hypothetical protein
VSARLFRTTIAWKAIGSWIYIMAGTVFVAKIQVAFAPPCIAIANVVTSEQINLQMLQSSITHRRHCSLARVAHLDLHG